MSHAEISMLTTELNIGNLANQTQPKALNPQLTLQQMIKQDILLNALYEDKEKLNNRPGPDEEEERKSISRSKVTHSLPATR